jgi:hypothetical protein
MGALALSNSKSLEKSVVCPPKKNAVLKSDANAASMRYRGVSESPSASRLPASPEYRPPMRDRIPMCRWLAANGVIGDRRINPGTGNPPIGFARDHSKSPVCA